MSIDIALCIIDLMIIINNLNMKSQEQQSKNDLHSVMNIFKKIRKKLDLPLIIIIWDLLLNKMRSFLNKK